MSPSKPSRAAPLLVSVVWIEDHPSTVPRIFGPGPHIRDRSLVVHCSVKIHSPTEILLRSSNKKRPRAAVHTLVEETLADSHLASLKGPGLCVGFCWLPSAHQMHEGNQQLPTTSQSHREEKQG